MHKKLIVGAAIIVIGIATSAFWYVQSGRIFSPTEQAVTTQGVMVEMPTNNPTTITTKTPSDVEVVAENLDIPWDMVFLPDSSMLVTQRAGTLLRIGKNTTPITIEGVAHIGEGGLLGIALHPQFSRNNFVYLYLTTRTGDALTNRVERYTLSGNQLTQKTSIIENIPGAQYHDGGRIAFGPDGKLYITTGDAGVSTNAQNTDSLAGKILRLNDDGSVPTDNPFGNAVWSYGHRNPQGIAWDASGVLWATEHGRSGVRSGFDEVNLIVKGANYGWPTIEGDKSATGMQTPITNSGASETWAPSGATVIDDTLLFAGLRGQSLYSAPISGTTLGPIAANLTSQFGRLRTVTVGPDGFLYILTSNKDGRGTPAANDDRIIRINPKLLGL